MKIGKHDVTGEAKYEMLYREAKKYASIFMMIFLLSGSGEIFIILNYISDGWIQTGVSFGMLIRMFLIIYFPALSWHKNTAEGSSSNVYSPKRGDILLRPGKLVIKPWFAVVLTVLCCSLLLSCITNSIIYLIYSIDDASVYNIVSLITCIIGIIAYSGLLYYLRQYFRYYRWTWDELLFPPEERKAHYKAKKSAERQKKREEREAKRESGQSSRTENSGFFAKRNEKPAAKIVKSQADRRAELENLKKLYDEGLIDEEEYKKAREKALDIQ